MPNTLPMEAAEALASYLEQLLDKCGAPRFLADYGIDREALAELASEAEKQWTGTFNPLPVKAAQFEMLYAAALAEPQIR